MRIENWTYEVRVTLQKGDQMPEKIAAAKAELQAYYDALVAGNRYSGEGTAQLQGDAVRRNDCSGSLHDRGGSVRCIGRGKSRIGRCADLRRRASCSEGRR